MPYLTEKNRAALYYLFSQYDKNESDEPNFVSDLGIFLGDKNEQYQDAIYRIREAAAKKNPDDLFVLGFLELHGLYVEKNIKKAIEHINESAILSQSDAQCQLGIFYENGLYDDNGSIIIQKDINKAYQYYNAAAEQSDIIAYNALRKFYREGICVKQDAKKATELYNLAVDAINIDNLIEKPEYTEKYESESIFNKLLQAKILAQFSSGVGHHQSNLLLADFYEKGILTNKSDLKAIEYYGYSVLASCSISLEKLREYSKLGFAEADYALARYYKISNESNIDLYLSHLRQSAHRDCAEAQYHLALYFENNDVKDRKEAVDSKSAIEYLHSAASKKYLPAVMRLAKHHKERTIENASDMKAFSFLETAVNEGCVEAYFDYAEYYNTGFEGQDKDEEKANQYYWLASDYGSVDALMWYARAFKDLPEPNLEKVFKYYFLAASSGNPSSKHYVAFCFEIGHGVNRNVQQADAWFNMLDFDVNISDAVSLNSSKEYGKEYDMIGSPSSSKKALKYYELAANKGDAESCYWLGLYYSQGKVVEKNYPTAIFYFQAAAAKDHVLSIVWLAGMYEKGCIDARLCKENLELAQDYYTRAKKLGFEAEECYKYLLDINGEKMGEINNPILDAAKLGYTFANLEMAELYFTTEKPPFDAKETYEIFDCLSHNPAFKYRSYHIYVAVLHEFGIGCPINLKRALFDYECASVNNPIANYALFVLYRDGKGVPKDIDRSSGYFQAALDLIRSDKYSSDKKSDMDEKTRAIAILSLYKIAAKFHPEAAYTLGRLYETGTIVPENIAEAAARYGQAALRYSHTKSIERLKYLAENDNYHAQYYYAILLCNDLTKSQDVEKAIHFFDATIRKANIVAAKDRLVILANVDKNAFAQYMLANLYLVGCEIIEKDKGKAIDLLNDSVKQDNPQAKYLLATVMLESGSNLSSDEDRMYKNLLIKAARKGVIMAHIKLAHYNVIAKFDTNEARLKNLTNAKKHYEIAANDGNIEAMKKLPIILDLIMVCKNKITSLNLSGSASSIANKKTSTKENNDVMKESAEIVKKTVSHQPLKAVYLNANANANANGKDLALKSNTTLNIGVKNTSLNPMLSSKYSANGIKEIPVVKIGSPVKVKATSAAKPKNNENYDSKAEFKSNAKANR